MDLEGKRVFLYDRKMLSADWSPGPAVRLLPVEVPRPELLSDTLTGT
jgi:hypothetical protein